MLLYRIATDTLPTKARLNFLGIESNDLCSFCESEPETCLHIFLHCPVARAVWFGSVWGLRIQSLLVDSPLKLIQVLIDPPTELLEDVSHINHLAIFSAVAFDAIWTARKQLIFEDKPLHMESLMMSINQQYQVQPGSLEPRQVEEGENPEMEVAKSRCSDI